MSPQTKEEINNIPLDNIFTKQMLDNGNMFIRSFDNNSILYRIKSFKINTDSNILSLLIQKGNKNIAPSSWINFNSYKIRNEEKTENEGYALSTHVLIDLIPYKNENIHLCIVERCLGMSMGNIESYLNKIFKEMRESKIEIHNKQYHTKCKFLGHISKEFEEDLKEGRMKFIEIFKETPEITLDEKDYFKYQKESLIVTPVSSNPLAIIKQIVKSFRDSKNYKNAKIVFIDKNNKQRTVEYNIVNETFDSLRYIKYDILKSDLDIPNCEEEINIKAENLMGELLAEEKRSLDK